MSENSTGYHYNDDVRHDILRMVPADGEVIASIGCGWAATEAELVRRGRQVHGADVAPDIIEPVGKRLSSMRLIGPDDQQPFETASLDGLILADVLEHLPQAWTRLQAFSRMVKPGGWVVVSLPNMRYVEVLWQLGIRGDWPEYPQGHFDSTHLQVTTHKRMLRWSKAAGLELERWYPAYDYRFLHRNVYRVIDLATLRLLHGFLGSSVQGVFRKRA